MSARAFVAGRVRSFRDAFRGIGLVLRTQPNARIHALATAAVVALGLALRVDAAGWRWLALAVSLVWAAEALNTALEHLADAVSEERHPRLRDAKDAAAGAVLLAAIGAAVVGLLVFGPRLLALAAAR